MKSKDEWLCLVALLLTIAITILFLFVPTKVTYEGLNTEKALAQTAGTTPIVNEVPEPKPKFTNPPSVKEPQGLPQALLDISWCESRDDQSKRGYNYRYRTITLEDGSTTTEKYLWSTDIGRFQINDYYHAETAKKLGMDIYTVEGNAQYALLLYNTNGTRDWNPSKPCWSNIDAYRAKEQSYY